MRNLGGNRKGCGGTKNSRVLNCLDSYLLSKLELPFAYLNKGLMGWLEDLIEIRFDAKIRGDLCMENS